MGTSELSGRPKKMLGGTCDGLASFPGGEAILLVASCYRIHATNLLLYKLFPLF